MDADGPHTARTFPGWDALSCFSERTLQLHMELYRGYVAATNRLEAAIAEADAPVAAELRRRHVWEANGMRLHERFFEALARRPTALKGPLLHAVTDRFGSADAWKRDLQAVAQTRGIGWAAVVHDRAGIRNVWLEEHATGLYAGTHILLLIDLFEHAYLLDHGADRDAYFEAVWSAIDWDVVARRFESDAAFTA